MQRIRTVFFFLQHVATLRCHLPTNMRSLNLTNSMSQTKRRKIVLRPPSPAAITHLVIWTKSGLTRRISNGAREIIRNKIRFIVRTSAYLCGPQRRRPSLRRFRKGSSRAYRCAGLPKCRFALDRLRSDPRFKLLLNQTEVTRNEAQRLDRPSSHAESRPE